MELERIIATSPAPGTPGSAVPVDKPIYAHDYPWVYFTPQSPRRRPESLVTVEDLRRLADVYDVARSAIQHLKREVTAIPLKIVARDDKAKGSEERIEQAREWFERSGGLGGRGRRRQQYEGVLIEDLCVVGAACVWYRNARNGRPYEVFPVDAATIRPKVDIYGWPGPGEIVWEQWIEGRKIRGFTRDEMQYDGLWPTSYSPYPKSPTEWVILCATTALKADEWDREWLTNGSMPAEMIAVPEDWKPADIKSYAAWFHDTLSGDIRARQMPKFVPAGMNKLMNPSRSDQQFQELAQALMLRTCSIYGVQPSSIGYSEKQYKVSQEGAFDQTSAFGAGVLLEWRKDHYDDLLERIGFPDLETQNVTDVEEDAASRTERLTKAAGAPYMTPNEARAEDGKEGIAGGEKLLIPATLVPAEELLAQSELATASSEQQLEAGEMQMTPGFGGGEGKESGGGGGSQGPAGAPSGAPAGGMSRLEDYESVTEYLRAAAGQATGSGGKAAGAGGKAAEGHWVMVDEKPVFIAAGTAQGSSSQKVHPLREIAKRQVAAKHGAVADALKEQESVPDRKDPAAVRAHVAKKAMLGVDEFEQAHEQGAAAAEKSKWSPEEHEDAAKGAKEEAEEHVRAAREAHTQGEHEKGEYHAEQAKAGYQAAEAHGHAATLKKSAKDQETKTRFSEIKQSVMDAAAEYRSVSQRFNDTGEGGDDIRPTQDALQAVGKEYEKALTEHLKTFPDPDERRKGAFDALKEHDTAKEDARSSGGRSAEWFGHKTLGDAAQNAYDAIAEYNKQEVAKRSKALRTAKQAKIDAEYERAQETGGRFGVGSGKNEVGLSAETASLAPDVAKALHGRLHVDDGGTYRFNRLTMKALKALPPDFLGQLERAGYQVHVGEKPLHELDDAEWAGTEGATQYAVGHAKGASYSETSAALHSRKGGKPLILVGKGSGYDADGSLHHEIGHALDERHGLAYSKETNDSYIRLYDNLSPYEQQDSPASSIGRREFIAESFRHWFRYPKREREQKFRVQYDAGWADTFKGILKKIENQPGQEGAE
jgi:hypothetical protein